MQPHLLLREKTCSAYIQARACIALGCTRDDLDDALLCKSGLNHGGKVHSKTTHLMCS